MQMSPVCTLSLSPSVATVMFLSSVSNETSAMSRLSSAPTSLPSNSRSSLSLILIFVAFPATWLFVSTYTVFPLRRTMMPLPRPSCVYSRVPSSLLPLPFPLPSPSPFWFGKPKKNGRSSNGFTVFTFVVSVTSTSTTEGRTPLLMERKVFCIASTTPSESAGIETAGVVSANATFAEPLFALHEKERNPKERAATAAMPSAFFVQAFIILSKPPDILSVSVNIMYFLSKCYKNRRRQVLKKCYSLLLTNGAHFCYYG